MSKEEKIALSIVATLLITVAVMAVPTVIMSYREIDPPPTERLCIEGGEFENTGDYYVFTGRQCIFIKKYRKEEPSGAKNIDRYRT